MHKVGIVGVSRGKSFVSSFEAHPDMKVTALCDVDQKLLAEVGAAFELPDSQLFEDYEAFLGADMDIVMIATPIPLHTEQTVKALESGRHVLCEQTVAYTVEECGRTLEAVKRSGRVYMMAENYCYFHYVLQWKELIASGRLGEIHYAEGEYIHEITEILEDPETGEFYWRADRPPIWYCAHTLGPLLTLMDDRVVRATGLSSGFHRFPDRKHKPGFTDMEVGLFQTAKGRVIKILRSQTPVRPHMVWYALYGTKGSVESGRLGDGGVLYIPDEMGGEEKAQTPEYSTIDPAAPPEARKGGHGTSEYFMIRDFLKAVATKSRPPIDVVKSIEMTVPGLVAHESATKGGVWLDVPQFEW